MDRNLIKKLKSVNFAIDKILLDELIESQKEVCKLLEKKYDFIDRFKRVVVVAKNNRLKLKIKELIAKLVDLPRKNKFASSNLAELTYDLRNNIILNLIECHFLLSNINDLSAQTIEDTIERTKNLNSVLVLIKELTKELPIEQNRTKDAKSTATKEPIKSDKSTELIRIPIQIERTDEKNEESPTVANSPQTFDKATEELKNGIKKVNDQFKQRISKSEDNILNFVKKCEPTNSNPTNSNPTNSNPTNSTQTNSNPTNSNQNNPNPANSNQTNPNPTNSNSIDSNSTDSIPNDEVKSDQPSQKKPNPVEEEPTPTKQPASLSDEIRELKQSIDRLRDQTPYPKNFVRVTVEKYKRKEKIYLNNPFY